MTQLVQIADDDWVEMPALVAGILKVEPIVRGFFSGGPSCTATLSVAPLGALANIGDRASAIGPWAVVVIPRECASRVPYASPLGVPAFRLNSRVQA